MNSNDQQSEAALRMEKRIGLIEQKLLLLEQHRQDLITEGAVNVERRKHLDERLDGIDDRLKTFSETLAKLGWLIGAAIVGSIASFVLKGGLTIVP